MVVSLAVELDTVDEAVELALEDADELIEQAWRLALEFASPGGAASVPSVGWS